MEGIRRMTNEEIIQGNELIAGFMGWIKTEKDLVFNSLINGVSSNTVFKGWIRKEVKYIKGVPIFVVKANKSTDIEYLRKLNYHSSWDSLMPVVEYCFNRYESVEDNRSNHQFILNDALLTLNILEVWKAVVNFIDWYNINKK
jgi:hypothetical protein